MKKFFLILLLGTLSFVSIQAQVKLYYKGNITGSVNIENVSKIYVTNFTGVTIEFVYKAKVLDENNKVVIEMISDVISCKNGITNYTKKELKGLRIIKSDIDISTYTGRLFFHSKIVHPQQHQSIIATAKKELFLAKGVSVTIEKKALSDPKLINVTLRINDNEKFELKDIYNRIGFQNANAANFCTDIDFEIKQNNKIIYKSVLKSLCIPPGKSKLTQKQRADLKVIIDNYKDRNGSDAIYVIYGNEDIGKSSSRISNYNHTVLDTDYKTYTNRSIDLSFDFVNYTTPIYLNQVSNLVVIFDKQNKVESIETLRTSSTKMHPIGVDSPIGVQLYRENFNGSVKISVLAKNSFNKQQLSAYIAYINQVDSSQLSVINSFDFKIIAPKQLSNNKPLTPGKRKQKTFSFCISSYERYILFSIYHTDTKNISDIKTVDMKKVLNSIVYNNVKLNFNFDSEGNLKNIQTKKIGKLKNKTELNNLYNRFLKYYEHLKTTERPSYFDSNNKLITSVIDPHIKLNKKENKIKTPRIAVITASLDTIRKYQTYKWDSIGIQFSHRAKKEFWSSVNKKVMGYYYKDFNKTENMVASMVFDPDKEFLEKYPNLIKFESVTLQMRPEFNLNIEVSRMKKNDYSDLALKAVVAYENTHSYSKYIAKTKHPKAIKLKSNGYEIFISEKLLNIGRFITRTNFFFIKSKNYLYQFKISGGFKSDILHFLNSIEINGDRLKATYYGNEILKNAEILIR